jgi:hypothetical protein
MASSDALPFPRKNVAYRVVFALRLNTGALNSGAAGLDSEVSKDQGTFADCTNEATEIATASGIYYLDLTSTEMNADCVAVIVKSSTTNAVTKEILLYPQETGDIRVDVDSLKQSGTAAQAQADLAAAALSGSVDTATFTATTTDFESSITTNVANFYVGRALIFTSGGLANQTRRVTGYSFTGNSKGKFTVDALSAVRRAGGCDTVGHLFDDVSAH